MKNTGIMYESTEQTPEKIKIYYFLQVSVVCFIHHILLIK